MPPKNLYNSIKLPKQKKAVRPSVQIGEVFSARVQDISLNGEGVVTHPCGLKVFVPGVWLDEYVSLKIVAVSASHANAELLEIEQASQHRITPPCAFQGFTKGTCGACAWMFVDYEAQLAQKQSQVTQSLSALGISNIPPILAAPRSLGYRNRAQFKTDGAVLGMVSYQQHVLVDIDQCLVLTDANKAHLQALRSRLPEKRWRPKKKAPWVTLNVGEQMTMGEVKVNQRLGFQQANNPQNDRIKTWLQQALSDCDTHQPMLELFCGAGNFTEVISAAGGNHIIAVEGAVEAIEQLQAKRLAGVTGYTHDLYASDAYQDLGDRIKECYTIVADPPREGIQHIDALIQQTPLAKDFLYVSCDLNSFIRDTEKLLTAGFNCLSLQPVDMFPQTPHIEVLAHFTRRPVS